MPHLPPHPRDIPEEKLFCSGHMGYRCVPSTEKNVAHQPHCVLPCPKIGGPLLFSVWRNGQPCMSATLNTTISCHMSFPIAYSQSSIDSMLGGKIQFLINGYIGRVIINMHQILKLLEHERHTYWTSKETKVFGPRIITLYLAPEERPYGILIRGRLKRKGKEKRTRHEGFIVWNFSPFIAT